VFPDGTLTHEGVFVEEDFAQGPIGIITSAITGGTGRYRGASGEANGVFVPNTDKIKVTVRLD